MLYLIGLGLASERDVTVEGLEIIKRCERVYLEEYTSILLVPRERLEEFYGRPVLVSDRESVESGSDEIMAGADVADVALLVVGDPLGATTHTDMILRAREKGIDTRVVHNASIYNAVGVCGLQLYAFGQTVSIPFFTETWKPTSFYPRIADNMRAGLHTLCLLDIKVKEISETNLARGRRIFEPPRFMTAAQAAQQLLLAEEIEGHGILGPQSLAIAVARVGSADQQRIVCASLATLAQTDMGPPLHSLVLIGPSIHPMELDYVAAFAPNQSELVDGMALLQSKYSSQNK